MDEYKSASRLQDSKLHCCSHLATTYISTISPPNASHNPLLSILWPERKYLQQQSVADRLDTLALRDYVEVVHYVGHGDVLHALAAVLVGALRVGGEKE